jgi:tetratricopeptide (TPR) repeat protein/transglutaminase-like putative cysteine protease
MSSKTPLVVLFLAWIALPSVLAQVNASEKPAASSSPSSDYSKEAYVIDKLHTRIAVEDDGTDTREVTAEIKMLADAGVKAFAVLSFTYTSANEVVDVDYVRVRKPDGTVVKTPDYNIQDMPAEVTRAAPIYSDVHEKHVAVKALAVGDVLEYLIRYRTVKAQVPGQFWYEKSFIKDGISKDEQLEINLPQAKYIKVVSPDFKPAITDEGTRRIYRWTHANLEVKEKDPYEVPRRIPLNPDVQVTTFVNWEEIGRWYGGLQKDAVQVTPAIQAKAAKLVKGVKGGDEEKIQAIYNFVALKFHYIGLSFGIGRYQPHDAEETLDNGYGDCKDKHTLLAALLKAAGYDAWPALIHSSRKLDAEVPSPAQFNHVITVVPIAGHDTWLDKTAELAPFALLLPQLRNKQALVIPTNQAPVLMTTPQNPPSPQRQEFSMKGKLDSDGTFTGHAEQIYEGDVAVYLRLAFRQVSQTQWKELVQRISSGENFGGEVSEVKVSPPDRIDEPFSISYDYVRKNFADWENHHTSAPLPPMGLEVMKDSKDRKPPDPVVLGAVGKVTYRSRVELPAGYVAVPPGRLHLSEPFAEYDGGSYVVDGVLTTNRVLDIKKPEIPLSDWEEYRQFGIALSDDEFAMIPLNRTGTFSVRNKDSDKNTISGSKELAGKTGDKDGKEADTSDAESMLRDAQDALQRQDVQKAEEDFQKIVTLHPDYKGAHFFLGSVLMYRSKFDEANEQFEKEEQISPSDPRAYQSAAALAALRGRTDTAIQEWRKLLKVDPDNRIAIGILAGLLYQAGKYAEAVDLLEPVVKTSPDRSELQVRLGLVYLKTGQGEKALANLRAAIEADPGNTTMLNEVAYELAEAKTGLEFARETAEEAVKKLEDRSINDIAAIDAGTRVTIELSMVWDTLGWVYFQSGADRRSTGTAHRVLERLAESFDRPWRTAGDRQRNYVPL